MRTPDKQVELMLKEDEVVVAKPMVAAVRTVDNDALLDASEDGDWDLKSGVALDVVERVELNYKERFFRKNCCAKRQKFRRVSLRSSSWFTS